MTNLGFDVLVLPSYLVECAVLFDLHRWQHTFQWELFWPYRKVDQFWHFVVIFYLYVQFQDFVDY